MFQNEEWTHINGYDNLYIISNMGRVKSFKRGDWKTLKPRKDTGGYLQVCLSKNGKLTTYRIHRLVALHFIPNPENKPEVNHIDENKENNAIWNLEWMTHKENINHGTRNARTSKKVSCYDIETGDFIKEFDSLTQACHEFKKPSNHGCNIISCCKGKQKTAYGYRWSYEKKDNFFN